MWEEVILDVLRNWDLDGSDLELLAKLIKAMKISKNHDTIASAWKRAYEERWEKDYHDVLSYIARQKREAEAEEQKLRDKSIAEAINEACDHRY